MHEAITDHSEGIKNLLSANLDQVVQNAVKQGQAEILAKQTAMQEQITSMQAQITSMQAQITSMQAQTMVTLQNVQIQAGNDSRHPGQGRMRLLRKSVAGHPVRKSTDKVDKALQNVELPFSVGDFPPSLEFFSPEGLTSDEIMRLTHSEIDNLAWFYNVKFDPNPSEYKWLCGSHLHDCLFACFAEAACEFCLHIRGDGFVSFSQKPRLKRGVLRSCFFSGASNECVES